MNQNQIGDMEQKLFMPLDKARHSFAKTHQNSNPTSHPRLPWVCSNVRIPKQVCGCG
jgi:hypothetical protein